MLLFALQMWVSGAIAADAVFTVAKYPVDGVAKNAVEAKETAIGDGQQAAFRSLLKRIVPVTAYKQISRLKDVKAGDLISGMSVRSERNSSTDYIATLDFTFQAAAVRAALTREGVPFVEQQAQSLLVVPVTRKPDGSGVENGTGLWRSVWSGLDLANTLTPIKLENFKPVIHNDTVSMLVNGEAGGLRIIANEYQSSRVVLAISEVDRAANKLIVTLAGQDAVGPINLKRTYRLSDGDVAYASELAAVVSLGVLEGRWKAVKSQAAAPDNAALSLAPSSARPAWSAAQTGSGQRLRLTAQFATLGQWTDIRTKLLNTPGVEALEIASVTARSADIGLSFPGGAQALASAVGARGMTLSQAGNELLLRPTF